MMKKRDWKIVLTSVGVTLALVLIIAIILRVCSFEIVYDPNVITNWDAVAGVAAWAAVVISVAAVFVSGLAIYYAIQVPKKIADRQDKIALFEKRYEVCEAYGRFLSFYEDVYAAKNLDQLHCACKHIFEERDFEQLDQNYVMMKSCKYEHAIHQMSMLFPGVLDAEVGEVYTTLFNLLLALLNKENIAEAREKFLSTFYAFNLKHGTILYDETSISNLKW